MFLDLAVWLARAEGRRGQRGLARWELTSEGPAGPCGARRGLRLLSLAPLRLPVEWVAVFALAEASAGGGPSPPSFSLGALAGMLGPQAGQGVKAAATTSFHHRSGPPWPWAQLALAASPGSGLRMDPAVVGAGSPQTQEDAGSLQIAPVPSSGHVTSTSAGPMMARDCLSPLGLCLCCCIGWDDFLFPPFLGSPVSHS